MSGCIPDMSKERVNELYARIKPVVRYVRGERGLFQSEEGSLHYIKEVNPFNVAFTWDPKPAKKAESLRELERIVTYHTWAYYGFFKPTIAEVLAQIPEGSLERTVAFETTTDDVEIVGSHHRTTTILYGRGRR